MTESYSSIPNTTPGVETSSQEKHEKKSTGTTESKPTFDVKAEKVTEKISNPSLWERLTGEKVKPEANTTASVVAETIDVAQAAAKNIDPAQAVEPEATAAPAESEVPYVEIPLGEVRDEAAEYIDLHQQVLAEEPVTTENNKEDAFLHEAADGVQTAEDDSSFKHVIDNAYERTVATLHDNPEVFTPPPAAPEATASQRPAYVPELRRQTEQAQRQAAEAASTVPPPPTPEAVPTPKTREDTSESVPWYYRYGDNRRFYPSPWPPKSPGRSLIEKVQARRQRRATEKAVEEKLDKQTEAVQRYIDQKEQAIRRETVPGLSAQPDQLPSFESVPATRAPRKNPEQAAASPAPKFETVPTPQSRPHSAERLQHLDHRELLATSEKILIDGTSLRRIYEAKQISELGLRRITTEYLRGGDIKHALDQELILKQMAYERDPQVRDDNLAVYGGSPTNNSGTFAIGGAPSTSTSTNTNAAKPAPAPASQSTTKKSQQKRATNPAEEVLVRAWIVVVVVLVVIVLTLILR